MIGCVAWLIGPVTAHYGTGAVLLGAFHCDPKPVGSQSNLHGLDDPGRRGAHHLRSGIMHRSRRFCASPVMADPISGDKKSSSAFVLGARITLANRVGGVKSGAAQDADRL